MVQPELRGIEQLLREARDYKDSRRHLLKRGIGLGLAVPAMGWLGSGYLPSALALQGDMTGRIVIALSVEPDSLENWKASGTSNHPIIRNVNEALLNRDPVSNELVGELATSWEQTDELTWRFQLREGVTFHNGEAFTAEVAAFGLNYTWSPENAFPIFEFAGPQLTATAVDTHTLDVTTVEPDPILPSRLYFSPIPSMQQVQEAPETLPDNPIGTGPYRFLEWNRGQYIRLEANPDWWGHSAEDAHGEVSIAEVEFVFREESALRAAMVVAGEAQLARYLAPEDCQTTPTCKTESSVETIFLRLDTMHPVMSDIRLRQAIALSIDKEAVAEQILGGGEPASQLVGPSATGYNPELEPYPYDIEQARQLVDEAAADGVQVDMPITVATRQGIFLRNDEFAEYVANQLNEIGLNARSEVIEFALYNEQYNMINYHDVPVDRGWIGTNPHGNEIMDVSSTASAYYSCDGGPSTYCDPQLDAKLAEAVSLTGEERVQALQEVTQMFYEDYGAIPIIHMPVSYGLAEDLQWQPRLDGLMLVKEMSFS